MSYQKDAVIPTTEDNYITSMAALNIPSEEDTGDWHFRSHFFPTKGVRPYQLLAGKDLLSTKEWLGDEGIYDCFPALIAEGVNVMPRKIYAANHYRAVADMVFHYVKSGYDIEKTISLNDWLPEPHEKARVYNLIDKLESSFNNDEWEKVKKWMLKTVEPD